jgi:AmiR/NasT family two-component response regulator
VADFDHEASPDDGSPEWPAQVELMTMVRQAQGALMEMHGRDADGAASELAARALVEEKSIVAVAREIVEDINRRASRRQRN